ncbi:MAG: hypothetical protein KC777_16330 [Cyanobacteria bacterium HKST-UBA02]|nr:hypothetical protein [Cyanobacteria bacterium HKST-UBA02]
MIIKHTNNGYLTTTRAYSEAQWKDPDAIVGTEHLLLALIGDNAPQELSGFKEWHEQLIHQIADHGGWTEAERAESLQENQLEFANFPPNLAAIAFRKQGITAEAARAVVRKLKKPKPGKANPGQTERFTRACDRSRKLARGLSDPEHLLLALLEMEEGGAHKVMMTLNVDRDVLRADILKLMSENSDQTLVD